jgi:hypothetical protein
MYLMEGSALHEALDAQAKGDDPLAMAHAYIDNERDKLAEAYAEINAFEPWDIELERFEESAEFVISLINQYFSRYGTENTLSENGLTYLATEVPFQLKLPVTADNGATVYFVGTWDGVAMDDAGKVFLVENKTYSSPPDSSELMFHDQSTGYAVAFHALTNTRLTGMLYNGVSKRLIGEPKLLKNGKLSTDKRQSVTSKSYIAAMQRHGINPYDDYYTDILTYLQERELNGDTRFFYREKFFYSDTQLESWYNELLDVADEMVNGPKIYRTVPFNGCGDCWFRDLCHTKYAGGDVEQVMKKYTTGTYGTMQAMQDATPTMIASIEQLKASLRDG